MRGETARRSRRPCTRSRSSRRRAEAPLPAARGTRPRMPRPSTGCPLASRPRRRGGRPRVRAHRRARKRQHRATRAPRRRPTGASRRPRFPRLRRQFHDRNARRRLLDPPRAAPGAGGRASDRARRRAARPCAPLRLRADPRNDPLRSRLSGYEPAKTRSPKKQRGRPQAASRSSEETWAVVSRTILRS